MPQTREGTHVMNLNENNHPHQPQQVAHRDASASRQSTIGLKQAKHSYFKSQSIAFLFLILFVLQMTPSAAVFSQITKLSGADDDRFGDIGAVSMYGDYVAIGAPYDDDLGSDSGSVYIYKSTGGESWEQTQKLTAGDQYDEFGKAVSMHGEYLAVGADGAQSVYVFKRTEESWDQTQKITSSSGYFGASLSLDGSYLAIGAYGDGEKATHAGAAFVFRRACNGEYWQEIAKLTADDAAVGDDFGFALSMDAAAGYLASGARYDDDEQSESGSVYLFREESNGSWTQIQKLTAADPGADDKFGYALSMDAGYLAVGAPGDDDKGSASGSVYVFHKECNWAQIAKLTASDGEAYDAFGYALSLESGYLAVGAPWKRAVYVFNSLWVEEEKVIADDGAAGDEFGSALASFVVGDEFYFAVGAPGDDYGAGSAYIFFGQNAWTQFAPPFASPFFFDPARVSPPFAFIAGCVVSLLAAALTGTVVSMCSCAQRPKYKFDSDEESESN